MAAVLWEKLPQYVGQEILKFSTEWLDSFKARHNIKKYKQYRESEFIDLVVVEKKLQKIWETINPYTNENIYNIDKLALFWKMIPDETLKTKQSTRGKNDKARITINLACNITRSHKLELWFIKKAAKLKCSRRSAINIKNFQIVWHNNKKV